MAETNKNNNRKRSSQTTVIKVGANEMGKLPPQAPELEDSVLGALMIEKDAYGTVADLLRPEVFYKDQNRLVYEAIRALASKDLPVDILSVGEKLRSNGTLEQAGGAVYLADLTRRVASTAHLRYHAQIVAQKATARDLIAMAATIEEKGFDEPITDVSEEDLSLVTACRTDHCENKGRVEGDINIGGIAGTLAIETEDREENAA